MFITGPDVVKVNIVSSFYYELRTILYCILDFPGSLVLFNLICMEVDVLTLYLSFEIRETMNTILYFVALIPLKSLLLPSGSHIVSCFSALAEIPF